MDEFELTISEDDGQPSFRLGDVSMVSKFALLTDKSTPEDEDDQPPSLITAPDSALSDETVSSSNLDIPHQSTENHLQTFIPISTCSSLANWNGQGGSV